MPDQTNIEAKLCSYIEGDLDAAGRAEIEQYLRTHPQYRAILDDVIRTRTDLRALPRVNAPAELQETVGGQLERAALLGDDNLIRTVGREPRFPHFRAWAAVIALTAALAAVIYSVLPARKANLNELADLRTAPVATSVVAPGAATESAPLSEASIPPTTGAAGVTAEFAADANTPAADRAASVAANAVTAAPSTQPVVVASIAPSTMPLASAAITASPAPTASAVEASAEAGAVAGSGALGAAAVEKDQVEALKSAPAGLNSGLSAEQTLIVPTEDINQASDRIGEYLRSRAVAFDVSKMPATATAEESAPIRTRTIIARNLTDSERHSVRQEISVIAGGSTTRPTSEEFTLNAGDRIQVVATDTNLGNVTAMDETMTIAQDGTIKLPLIGNVPAAGMTPGALSKSIESSYELAKSPTRATWSIHPAPAEQQQQTFGMANGNATAKLNTNAAAQNSNGGQFQQQQLATANVQRSQAFNDAVANNAIQNETINKAAQRNFRLQNTTLPNTMQNNATIAGVTSDAEQFTKSGGAMGPRSDLTIVLLEAGGNPVPPMKTAVPATVPSTLPATTRDTTQP
ncbi:MAG: polysaccharide biosynthesis/export family protein [Phycisphaerae bacterium]|nr:polysaccharide biosynthesis/export family protein [Phycisphaerae bacterium]